MKSNIEEDVKILTEEELLKLYNQVLEHLKYLNESLISLDEGGEDSE